MRTTSGRSLDRRLASPQRLASSMPRSTSQVGVPADNATRPYPTQLNFPDPRARPRQWHEVNTSWSQISSTLRNVARSRHHKHQPWRRTARRLRRALHPPACTRSRTQIQTQTHILLRPLYLSSQVRTASAHPAVCPRTQIPAALARSRTVIVINPARRMSRPIAHILCGL